MKFTAIIIVLSSILFTSAECTCSNEQIQMHAKCVVSQDQMTYNQCVQDVGQETAQKLTQYMQTNNDYGKLCASIACTKMMGSLNDHIRLECPEMRTDSRTNPSVCAQLVPVKRSLCDDDSHVDSKLRPLCAQNNNKPPQRSLKVKTRNHSGVRPRKGHSTDMDSASGTAYSSYDIFVHKCGDNPMHR